MFTPSKQTPFVPNVPLTSSDYHGLNASSSALDFTFQPASPGTTFYDESCEDNLSQLSLVEPTDYDPFHQDYPVPLIVKESYEVVNPSFSSLNSPKECLKVLAGVLDVLEFKYAIEPHWKVQEYYNINI